MEYISISKSEMIEKFWNCLIEMINEDVNPVVVQDAILNYNKLKEKLFKESLDDINNN